MARIVDKATAVASMLAGGDWATGAYLRTLFDGNDPGTYVVLKPSPETSPDVIRLGELIAASGFPPGPPAATTQLRIVKRNLLRGNSREYILET